MNRLMATMLFALALSRCASAQQPSTDPLASKLAIDFSQTSAASQTNAASPLFAFQPVAAFPALSSSVSPAFVTSLSDSGPALFAFPLPSSRPQRPASRTRAPNSSVGVEAALNFAVVRFRSSVYSATAIGYNVNVAFYLNDWFGIEGDVTPAFSVGTVFAKEHVKYLGYGGGPRFVLRRGPVEPWGHIVFGGAHILPQTAAGHRNGFDVQGGGGADFVLSDNVAWRVEGDLVHTSLFGASQNSFQVLTGLVLRF